MSTSQNDRLKGMIAAVPTPMTKDGSSIDLKPIPAIVNRLIKAGINGIVTTGTTGEVTSLSMEEHQSIVKAYVEAVNGKIPVIAGIATNSTKLTIEYCQKTEKLGVFALMIVAPFYDPLSFESVKKFYQTISDNVNVPLIYYNLPGSTGIHLNSKQIHELGKIKNLHYIKDTSGNMKEQITILNQEQNSSSESQQSKIKLHNGWDTYTFSALALGVEAVILGTSTLVPKECVEFYKTLAIEGDLKKARKQWNFLWTLCDYLENVNYPAAIKAGMEIIGIEIGSVREPTLPLSKEDLERLREILDQRTYKD